MAEEQTTETGVDAGQSGIGPEYQTTETEPTDAQGQSAEETTQPGPSEDVFFDPREIQDDPKLQAAYKQMQRAYTKKMQSISDQRQKIDAYDAFYQNPIEQVQRIAQQYGYSLSRAEAQQAVNQQNDDWQPNNWNDVMTRATEIAEKRIMEKMNPVFSQVQNMRKQSIESQLSEIDPTWQQYEDRMKGNLNTHPSLANDPVMLYRVSVPTEVLESRATQAALRKMEARQQSAQVSGKSTTSKNPASGLPDGPVSFQDAVAAAKKSLADQGITG